MSLFNSRDITVVPRSTATYTRGRWTGEVAGASTIIKGSWQPATPTEIKSIPELRREQSVMRIYTTSNLNGLATNHNPDRVVLDGVTYEIYARTRWNNGLIPHYKYLATEVLS